MISGRRTCTLIILDGWGIGSSREGNALAVAKTPYLDYLEKSYPRTRLICSGEAVGLPPGVMGNSEVGHLNIGAGRIVNQDLLRINEAIETGEFRKNRVFHDILDRVKEKGSSLHLIGLLSDGGVHSHIDHLLALVDLAQERGLEKVLIHVILDGRDTPPDSGLGYVSQLQAHMEKTGFGQIATICGRFYAMDRDTRWERTRDAYLLYTQGTGVSETDPVSALEAAYERGETDEFVKPIVLLDGQAQPVGVVTDGDGMLCFDFRADRVRQITRAFTDPDFVGFERPRLPRLIGFVCMALYDGQFDLPVAFPPVLMKQLLGEVFSSQGLRQLRIAETEKYAHVTYFFNGGAEEPFDLEDRCLIPSPREVATYDLKPEMSAGAVADEVVSRIKSRRYDLMVVNLANMDMVGHTGILDAAVKACETVDGCVEKIIAAVKSQGGLP